LLERVKEQQKQKESTENKPRSLRGKLVGALKAAKEEFNRKNIREPERQKASRFELVQERDAEVFGSMPTAEELSAKRAKQEDRQKRSLESAWKYYSTAIELDYGGEKVHYNWHTSLFELKKLQGDYLKPDSIASKQLSEDDYKRLDTWIKDGAYLEKRLYAQAMSVRDISLELSAERSVQLTKDSSLTELNKIRKMDRKGDIVLTAVEAKALDLWIREQEKAEPITMKMTDKGDEVLYERSDSREVLEFLAAEYKTGEKWAQGMKRKEYSKLLSWIKEKREQELEDRKPSKDEEKEKS